MHAGCIRGAEMRLDGATTGENPARVTHRETLEFPIVNVSMDSRSSLYVTAERVIKTKERERQRENDSRPSVVVKSVNRTQRDGHLYNVQNASRNNVAL